MTARPRLKGLLIVSMLVCSSLVTIGTSAQQHHQTSEDGPALCFQGGWTKQDSGVTTDLNGLSAVNQNQAAIAGDSGVILGTIDGGNQWSAQDSGFVDNLFDVSFADNMTGLAVGIVGTILTTSDAGQTWVMRQTGMMEDYYTAQMLDDSTGFIGGVDGIHEALLLWTTTGWDTWDWTGFWINYQGTLVHARFTDIYFYNASYGLATAYVNIPSGGAMLRTTDGGLDWNVTYITTALTFQGLDATPDGTVYAVGDQGAILKSTDFGQTWSELSSVIGSSLYSVSCLSATSAITVGADGVILRTDDGGGTWASQESGVSTTLRSVKFVDSEFGWVVGDSGVILHTTTGGLPEDLWPPTTTCTLSGTMDGTVYLGNVTVTLIASDNLSGVAQTLYSVDNGNWTTYQGPFVVGTVGNHTLTFYSVDNAGNVEVQQAKEFTIQYASFSLKGGLGLQVTVKNLGSEPLVDEAWTLSLQGGLIVVGKSSSGSVSLQPGEETTVKSMVLGFGRTQVTFSIGSLTKTVPASVFLIFVKT